VINLKSREYFCSFFLALLLIVANRSAVADDTSTRDDAAAKKEPATVQQFGGAGSVPGQLKQDRRYSDAITAVELPKSYTEGKKGLRENNGFDFTVDYSASTLWASNTSKNTFTPNDEDFFAGGVIRFFGQWDLTGRDSGNTGSLIWKIENRHGYTDIAPNGVKTEIGYIGLISPVYSDIGTRLTNLYWNQKLKQGNIEIAAGFLDTTDWVDVYALAPPWTGFTNFAFATGSATIAPPDEAALGVWLNAMLTEDVYILAGFADSNSDSTDPFEGFDTFFNDHEFFKSVEIGLVTSRDRFYMDNTHITLWHADEREEAGVKKGYGAAFSYSHSFADDRWMPFLRGGYAKDGGTLLQKSVSTGFAYHWDSNNNLFGLGLNWGQPNEDTFGSKDLDDQYAIEVFSRLQITQDFQVTPDIQYIRNPALNTDANHSWVFGLRARAMF
jgi:porin